MQPVTAMLSLRTVSLLAVMVKLTRILIVYAAAEGLLRLSLIVSSEAFRNAGPRTCVWTGLSLGGQKHTKS